jgi:tRNA threonylcarbamoyladenosine biosynthesis protein TsaB
MLILGVDTSGKNGSIALVKFKQETPQTFEVVPLEGGTFSAQLVPQISELLGRHNLTKREIDGFAVVSGPGSFTGLRVGLAAIKALAEVLQKPIAVVSLLEAIGRKSGLNGEVTAVLDAGRSEIYAAEFCVSEKGILLGEQRLVKLEEFVSSCNREMVTPDAKIIEFARRHGLHVHEVPYPRADFIAALGFKKIKRGETVSPIDLDANYIRRSDAEIKQAAR